MLSLQMLIAAKAVFTWQDKFGRSPVHIAAQHGSRDCLVALKLHDASLEHQTYDGFSPLYLAAKNGHKRGKSWCHYALVYVDVL